LLKQTTYYETFQASLNKDRLYKKRCLQIVNISCKTRSHFYRYAKMFSQTTTENWLIVRHYGVL